MCHNIIMQDKSAFRTAKFQERINLDQVETGVKKLKLMHFAALYFNNFQGGIIRNSE